MLKIKQLGAILLGLGLSLGASMASAEQVTVDPEIETYTKTSGVSGNLSSVGSDTLNNLMTFWAEGFREQYPSVNVQIEGKGSSTAPPALISGTAQLGPMSRPMKSEEISEFESKYGFKPTGIPVALDALAVFVNKDNPLTTTSLQEVDAAFSKTRARGLAEDIRTWGQLGLKGDWNTFPLSLYGRNSASGTYGFFKEVALKKGDFKDTVKEQPGSAAVVQGVSEDRAGIGYSGIGYITSGVKMLALSDVKGAQGYAPTYENVLSQKYPLARPLMVYVAKDPQKGLDPLTKEFLKFVLSREGQEIVVKDGYLPLPAKVIEQQLKALE